MAKYDAVKCNKKAVVVLNIDGKKQKLCYQHWKESYD